MGNDKNKNLQHGNIKKESGFRAPILSNRKSILSLEPALVLHIIGNIIVFTVLQDVLLDNACRVDLGFPKNVCDALQQRQTEGYEKEEQAVQQKMGKAVVARAILENVFPIILVVLIGAWSDKYGRKYPLLMVMGSFILHHIFLLFAYLTGSPAGILTITIVSSLILSISGNSACLYSSAFSYASDHAQVEEQTVRLVILNTCIYLGVTVGLGISIALAMTGLSFTAMYFIGLLLETLAFLYLHYFMKNHSQPGVRKGKTGFQIFKELFNFQHIWDAGNCLVKEREGDCKRKLALLLISYICIFTPMMGEHGVFYLFCRYQFNWNLTTYSWYMTFRSVVGFFGSCVSTTILKEKMRLSDTQQGIAACASCLIGSLIYTFATSSFYMFLGPIIMLFSGVGMVVPRSMLAKFIASDELGKINACIASLESIVPFIASGLYAFVYSSFLDKLPGSFFLISAGLAIPPILIFDSFRRAEVDELNKNQ